MAALPIYHTTSKEISMLQTNWAKQLNPVLDLPLNSGQVLQNISLLAGNNVINHLLGRKLQGWFFVRQRAAATVYDTQDNNQTPALTLTLNASAPVSVDIFVF